MYICIYVICSLSLFYQNHKIVPLHDIFQNNQFWRRNQLLISRGFSYNNPFLIEKYIVYSVYDLFIKVKCSF